MLFRKIFPFQATAEMQPLFNNYISLQYEAGKKASLKCSHFHSKLSLSGIKKTPQHTHENLHDFGA